MLRRGSWISDGWNRGHIYIYRSPSNIKPEGEQGFWHRAPNPNTNTNPNPNLRSRIVTQKRSLILTLTPALTTLTLTPDGGSSRAGLAGEAGLDGDLQCEARARVKDGLILGLRPGPSSGLLYDPQYEVSFQQAREAQRNQAPLHRSRHTKCDAHLTPWHSTCHSRPLKPAGSHGTISTPTEPPGPPQNHLDPHRNFWGPTEPDRARRSFSSSPKPSSAPWNFPTSHRTFSSPIEPSWATCQSCACPRWELHHAGWRVCYTTHGACVLPHLHAATPTYYHARMLPYP